MRRANRLHTLRFLGAVIPLLLACCAGSYKMILLSDLDYKKCWLSKPDAGVSVFASKQPLYETRNTIAFRASQKKNLGVFAVRIENTGAQPLSIDSAHVLVLDEAGNPAAIEKDALAAAKLLGAGQPLRDDLASNPLWGNTLDPGKSYCALIAVATAKDPYFATYYLRFVGPHGAPLTEARF